ncbi:hypothetical protein JYU34_003917 [Plutella xylostella]|uniref:Uncharacterized protein n=1 Tax=Plutella xylostella TaxID=51655 RepID=A0ABQ7R191_PLUXY|nr:hypothetical protein JYU34_003917 [Plutella xylostella]
MVARAQIQDPRWRIRKRSAANNFPRPCARGANCSRLMMAAGGRARPAGWLSREYDADSPCASYTVNELVFWV